MRKAVLRIIGVFLMIGEVLDYLALPAVFVAIGVLNGFGWQYYAWVIGGYCVLVILAELVGALIGAMLGNTFELRLLRKLKKASRLHEPKEEI